MKILIVDDEMAVKEAIELLLDMDICPVDKFLYAPNGARALEMLESEQPDIMFCDMQMPILSGDQLMKEIIRRNLKTQIIAVSGYSDFHYVRATMQASGIDYILKPVNPEELNSAYLRAVEQVKEQKKQQEDERSVRIRQAERILVHWLNRRQRFNNRVKEALDNIGIAASGTCLAVILLRNASNIMDDMFGEDDLLFYQSVDKLTEKCVGNDHELLVLDEYLYVLFFPRLQDKNCEAAMHRLCAFAKNSLDLDLVTEYAENEVSHQQISDTIEKLKGRILQHQLNIGLENGEYNARKEEGQMSIKQLESLLQFLVRDKQLDKIGRLVCAFGSQCFQKKGMTLGDFQLVTGEMNQIIHRLANAGVHIEGKKPASVSLWLFDEKSWTERFKNNLYELAEYQTPKKMNIEAVYQFLQEHYAQNVTIGMLTEHFYQSPQYISKRFKERYGITIITALTAIRMEQARLFLENTDMTVSQVAEKTGYVDEGYFSKIFKKENGMNPKQYQQTKRGGVE